MVYVLVDRFASPRVQLPPRHHAVVVHSEQPEARRRGAPKLFERRLHILERLHAAVLVVIGELAIAGVANHDVGGAWTVPSVLSLAPLV